MTEKLVGIKLENGLEARPIAVLVQKASMFESKVYLKAEGKRVNAKSIMGMMSLVLSTGNTVTIDAEGDDEDKAIVAMEKFLTN